MTEMGWVFPRAGLGQKIGSGISGPQAPPYAYTYYVYI